MYLGSTPQSGASSLCTVKVLHCSTRLIQAIVQMEIQIISRRNIDIGFICCVGGRRRGLTRTPIITTCITITDVLRGG